MELLKRGGSQFISEAELKSKLEERRTLRVKLGVDPTSPDLHLGHSVNLFKLQTISRSGPSRRFNNRRFHLDGRRSERQVFNSADADP